MWDVLWWQHYTAHLHNCLYRYKYRYQSLIENFKNWKPDDRGEANLLIALIGVVTLYRWGVELISCYTLLHGAASKLISGPCGKSVNIVQNMKRYDIDCISNKHLIFHNKAIQNEYFSFSQKVSTKTTFLKFEALWINNLSIIVIHFSISLIKGSPKDWKAWLNWRQPLNF